MSLRFLTSLSLALTLPAGCSGGKDSTDTDTDGDADTDADSDADADTDADSDADSDTDPGTFACADEDGGAIVPVAWTGSTLGAGDDRISYCSYYDGGEDYFFQFTASADGTYIFDTRGTSFVPILSLYEACGGYEAVCELDSVAELVVPLVAGQQVLIGIEAYYPGTAGDFAIYARVATPTEVECSDARDDDLDGLVDCIDSDCGPAANCVEACPDTVEATFPAIVTGSTVGSPDEVSADCDGSGGTAAPDQSIAFTAPSDGTYGFALSTARTDFDTVLSVFDTCGGTELACADLGGIGGEAVSLELRGGESVTVMIDGYLGDFGDYELQVFRPRPVETCDDTIDDDLDSFVDCIDEDCEIDPACPEDCDNGLDDDNDGVPDCFDVICGLDPVCAEDCTNGLDDNGNSAVDCTDPACGAVPACAETCPEEVLVDPLPIQVAGDITALTDDNNGCVNNLFTPDYSYEFTAPADATYTMDTQGSAFDSVLYVLDSCGGEMLICNDDENFAGGIYTSKLVIPLVAGQTVIVVVDTYDLTQSGDYVLNIE